MKISLAQINIIFEDKEKNKLKVLEFLNKAKKAGSDIILFPEMTLTGFSMNIEKISDKSNETLNWFEEQAIKFNLHLGFGYVEKNLDKGKNKFLIISPNGKTVSNYTKIHPFSYALEDNFYEGGKEIVISKINDFTISTFVCYDLRFPEVFQIASKKAELIFIIADWPKSRREHWITLLKARAIETQCYIAAVNSVGLINDLEYSGDSMIIDPLGNILAIETDLEALVNYDICLNEVIRIRNSFSLKKDRKESLYFSFYSKTT